MGSKRPDEPLTRVNFFCKPCRHKFAGDPLRVESAPEREWHPWLYFAACPICAEEAGQAGWEMGLMATYGKHTGPRTPEGLAAVTANLDGHPTPEEARRTRFNAVKHGLRARIATYFPAKPGSYPHCEGCEHLETWDCKDFGACLKRSELFLKFHAAFQQQRPELLNELVADTQAGVFALINDMLLAIAQDGARLSTPEWYSDKDGGFHLAKYTDPITGEPVQIHKIEAHPLLKHLMDYVAKNGAALPDFNMTPRVRDQEELLGGYLDDQVQQRESAAQLQQRSTEALEDLREMIARGQSRTQRDPVLIEHGEVDERG